MAAVAERHALYEEAVQAPDVEVQFVSRTFRKLRGRAAMTIREDFCGTAVFSVAWARSDARRRAIGVDLDGPTLEWGAANRIAPAGESVTSRVRIYEANVLDGVGPKTDVVVAFNFSYWIFKERDLLRQYFETARSKLVGDGLFLCDVFGGTETFTEALDDRDEDGFIYEWEQVSFDAITHDFVCAIHFELPDGSRIENAYTYEWRAWTIPELRDLLIEAGFSKVRVMWEQEDEDGEGIGRFHEPRRVDNDGAWWGYLVAER
jgi:hypothetical protein